MRWAQLCSGRADRSKPAPITPAVRAQFQELGLTTLPQPKKDEPFQIMPSNWQSFIAFLACRTQWRVVGIGLAGMCWIGLDYSACRLVLDDLKSPPHVFADLHVMELAALAVLNGGDR